MDIIFFKNTRIWINDENNFFQSVNYFFNSTKIEGSMFSEHPCAPRSEAAVALGKIRDNRAVEALIEVIEESADPGLMEKSAWALSELGDKRHE